MRIKTLSLGLGLDLAALGKDVEAAADRIARLGDRPVVLGVEAGASEAVKEFAAVGDMLAARLSTAFRGPSGIKGQFDALSPVVDRTAGTIITAFRRIDNEISFPKVQATLKRISDGLVRASAVGVFAGGGENAARALEKTGVAARRLWDVTPVARFWADYEARGKAAVAKVAFRDSVPKTRTTVGVGRAITPAGTQVSASERALAENYARITEQANALRKAMLGVRLAAQITGTVVKEVAVQGVMNLKFWASALTLPVAAYIKLRAGIWALSLPLTRIRDVAGKGFSAIFGGATSAAGATDKAARSAGLLGASFRAAAMPIRATGAAVGAVTATASRATSVFRGLGVQILGAFGFFGVVYQGVRFIKDGVKAASDFNETVNATKQVFGDSYGQVEAVTGRIQKQFGILQKSQLDAASAFGSIAKGAGATDQQVAGLGTTFTQLAADFASFKNLSFEDAAQKLRSGLAGETEPLRAYGVIIKQTLVEAEALRLGLGTVVTSGKKSKTTFSELALVQARASLIMRGLGDAQGDLNRTQGDAANQFRNAGGGVALFGEKIGQVLLPAVKAGTVAFNEVLASVIEFVEASRPTIKAWTDNIVWAFNQVGVVLRNSGAFWEIGQLYVGQFVENAVRRLEVLPANLALIADWIGSQWVNLLADAFTGATAVLVNFGFNLAEFATAAWAALQGEGFNPNFRPLLDGFEAATAALPDLIKPALLDVQAQVDEILGGVFANEAKRLADMPGAVAKAAGAVADAAALNEPGKKPEMKLASAVELGSKEAYSAIVMNRANGGKDPIGKEQVGLQRKMVNALDKIEKKLPGGNAPAVFEVGAA